MGIMVRVMMRVAMNRVVVMRYGVMMWVTWVLLIRSGMLVGAKRWGGAILRMVICRGGMIALLGRIHSRCNEVNRWKAWTLLRARPGRQEE